MPTYFKFSESKVLKWRKNHPTSTTGDFWQKSQFFLTFLSRLMAHSDNTKGFELKRFFKFFQASFHYVSIRNLPARSHLVKSLKSKMKTKLTISGPVQTIKPEPRPLDCCAYVSDNPSYNYHYQNPTGCTYQNITQQRWVLLPYFTIYRSTYENCKVNLISP